jgi:hypothetical protein
MQIQPVSANIIIFERLHQKANLLFGFPTSGRKYLELNLQACLVGVLDRHQIIGIDIIDEVEQVDDDPVVNCGLYALKVTFGAARLLIRT